MNAPTKILLGLGLGLGLGIAANLLEAPWVEAAVTYGTDPLGKMWLSALVMVVVPLIMGTLVTGVAGLGSAQRLGRIGLTCFLSVLGMTVLAVLLGLVAMNAVRPGARLAPEVRQRLVVAYKGETEQAMGLSQRAIGMELLTGLVPRNPVKAAANGDLLALLVFALVLGVALNRMAKERAEPLLRFLDSLAGASLAIIELVMKAAPVGVFCLLFTVMARFGLSLLGSLAAYFLTVLGSLALFQFFGYALILRVVAKRDPRTFFKAIRTVMITAFSTSSSNATFPTTLAVAQRDLGIPRDIAAFVLGIGATTGQMGTALFEGASALFLAQVFGIHLDLLQQVVVVAMAVFTSIGVAGIPGGSIPLLMVVLGMVGIPMEGIAIILGIDRILDMSRTVLNVTGDLVTAAIVVRVEEGRAPLA